MNEDGIMDLVVGARYSQEVIIHLGNGNGTFAGMPPEAAGGLVWQITCGDVNGDGHMDVTTANSQSNSGSILLGDGAGGLTLTQVQPTASHVVATDLGDYSSICLGGPGVLAPPPGCSHANFVNSDIEGDGDADLADFARLQSDFDAP